MMTTRLRQVLSAMSHSNIATMGTASARTCVIDNAACRSAMESMPPWRVVVTVVVVVAVVLVIVMAEIVGVGTVLIVGVTLLATLAEMVPAETAAVILAPMLVVNVLAMLDCDSTFFATCAVVDELARNTIT